MILKQQIIYQKDVIASYQQAIIDVLVTKVKRAMKMKGVNTCVIAGGVAANKCLRKNLKMVLANEKNHFSRSYPTVQITEQ